MKQSSIIQINTTCGVGSTGKITVSISELLTERDIDNYILFSSSTNGYEKGISCCTPGYTKLQALKSRVFGNYGFNSKSETRKMIAEIDKLSPDAVLLHNIHGHDCNLTDLFSYFAKKGTKLFWTFHDCWAFTAYCPHFTFAQCERWMDGCHHCPQKKQVSWFFDRSQTLYRRKKELLSNIHLTIITPSVWLAGLVKQSFLKDHPVRVIHNGIDLSVFRPTSSDFRQRHHISDEQRVLLGVASEWGEGKGLDVFVDLAKRLDNKYRVVLVGTDDKTDRVLPQNIISVHHTRNPYELAEIYTVADLFINPTREDTFPTVNLEALGCGTPVITFNTGGSPECIDETCGSVVPVDNVDALVMEIVRASQEHPFTSQACIEKAMCFEKNTCFEEYIDLILSEIEKK